MPARYVAVVDIAKAVARAAVVDLDSMIEVDQRKTINQLISDGPYPHFGVDALWAFIVDSLTELSRERDVDAICVTTFGSSAALIGEDGELVLPVLDFEYAGPDAVARDYDKVRPDFTETFSPRLSAGRNLGAQLFWQQRTFPGEFSATKWILPYPQYWGYRLTGVPCSEITSLGCHTDLWNVETDLYSSLVLRQGWLDKMPEVRRASEVLGALRPELCQRTGLKPETPVHVGIHAQNADLLPHLIDREPPFAVVATGPRVNVYAPGGSVAGLDPSRDSLVYLDAFGRPVPAARFMGGKEYKQLIGEQAPVHVGDAAVARVLDEPIMLLPSVTQGSGPFPASKAHWSVPEHTLDQESRFVAVSFYLALMAAECLEITGADGHTLVEGPFASNRLFIEMLVAATNRGVEAIAGEQAGSTVGAALLARMACPEASRVVREPIKGSPLMSRYAEMWREAARK
jgi:sugar (pentulose or hexulose) kinase